MTENEQAQRLTDFTLGMRVLRLTDRLDLTDEATALIEEAAQRLIDSEADHVSHPFLLPQKDGG